jgi:ABC-type multidrug transport system fused ATPase/permease subunit
VERQAERVAFAKAYAYLDYHKGAKWAAQLAAVGIGIVSVALLVVLWLFADLMVSRGRLPNYYHLTPAEQAQFIRDWSELSVEERQEQLSEVIFEEDDVSAAHLAALEPARNLSPGDLGQLWRCWVRHILLERLGRTYGPVAAGQVPLDRSKFDAADVGILSLVVRDHLHHRYVTTLIAWLARWNYWMWNGGTAGHRLFPSLLSGLVLVGLALAVLGAALTYLQQEMAARAVIEASNRLRRAVYHHTFRLGTLAFRALGPTEAVGVFARHVEAVHDALYTRLTVSFREPVKFALLLAFAFVAHIWLALAFLIFAILVYLVAGQLAGYFQRRARQASHDASERLTIMRESLMLMRLVKCYIMEQFNQARVERQLARYSQVQLIRYRAEAIYQPLLALLGLCCALILLFVAGVIVLYGQMSVAGEIALATALVSLYWPLQRWLEARRIVRRGKESALQVFRFLERRGDVGQVVGAEFLPPLARQVEFDSVTLREPGTGRTLLEDVSLTIPAGKRIGLIGSDELEKHALAYLIPRLLDPTSGEIRIDAHNLRWVTLDSLRTQIATVLTHNLVFHDTVANNIGCGDSAYTLPQIIEAAKTAHAHHFIQKLPQGYDTPIGELGHSLSVSEQYRIALARAVLRDPALLIIEEPESALDDETKALLDDTLTRFLPGRTAIFLPHRISTIRSCDRLYLLHKGRIVASGIHKELLAQNPLYRHLHYLEFNEIAESV